MTDATTAAGPAARETRVADGPFILLENALRDLGPSAALDRLTDHLAAAGEYRALLDALLLKARHELGLPLITSGSLANIPEPARSQYEEKYVAAIRLVGSKFLEAGDIPTAWAYYRGSPRPSRWHRPFVTIARRRMMNGWERSSRSRSTTGSVRSAGSS